MSNIVPAPGAGDPPIGRVYVPTSPAPPPDSLVHLELPINTPMRSVVDTERDFLGIFGEVAREVADVPRGEPIQWLLAHASTNGVIRIRLNGRIARDDVPASIVPSTVSAVVTGLAAVEESPVRPDFFSDRALELSQDVAQRTAETGAVRVVNGSVATSLTVQGVAAHVGELLGPAYADYGAVEGLLEGVNLHVRERYFNVYDPLTSRALRCYFAQRVPVRQVADALGARVAVYGMVNYRSNGDVASVLVEALEQFPPDSDLPSFDDVRGILG